MDLTGLTLREDVLQHLFMRGVVVMRLAWLEVLINMLIETKPNSFTDLYIASQLNLQYVALTHWTIFVVNCVNIVVLTIVRQRRSLQCMPDVTIHGPVIVQFLYILTLYLWNFQVLSFQKSEKYSENSTEWFVNNMFF